MFFVLALQTSSIETNHNVAQAIHNDIHVSINACASNNQCCLANFKYLEHYFPEANQPICVGYSAQHANPIHQHLQNTYGNDMGGDSWGLHETCYIAFTNTRHHLQKLAP